MLFIRLAYSDTQVTIDFLYWDPSKDPHHYCPTCPGWTSAYEDFIKKNDTLNRIQSNYTGKVLINWIDFYSALGREKEISYNITTQNSLIIMNDKGNFTTIQRDLNETYLRNVIEAYLGNTLLLPSPPATPFSLMAALAGALAFGFFETFSPCLLILLSFVLSYSVSETTKFKESFLKVMTFGIGFICATMLVFIASVGLAMISLAFALQDILSWVILAIVIFFGLDLLGLNILKFLKIDIETKSTIQKLSKRLVFSYLGLITLGFLFYFLDPCIAPIFVVMVGTFQQALLEFLPLILFVFCIGVILPFIGIGILAGSISKLVRGTYRHRSKIRALSGIILIAYAFYFVINYII
jgi:cytochrome c biogenesis protein CcdA